MSRFKKNTRVCVLTQIGTWVPRKRQERCTDCRVNLRKWQRRTRPRMKCHIHYPVTWCAAPPNRASSMHTVHVCDKESEKQKSWGCWWVGCLLATACVIGYMGAGQIAWRQKAVDVSDNVSWRQTRSKRCAIRLEYVPFFVEQKVAPFSS